MAKDHFFFCQQMDLQRRMHPGCYSTSTFVCRGRDACGSLHKRRFHALITGQLRHSTSCPELNCGDGAVWVVRVVARPAWLLRVGK